MPPALPMSSSTSSSLAVDRAARQTLAPRRASAIASRRPMPCEAPVTMATRPAMSKRSFKRRSSLVRGDYDQGVLRCAKPSVRLADERTFAPGERPVELVRGNLAQDLVIVPGLPGLGRRLDLGQIHVVQH